MEEEEDTLPDDLRCKRTDGKQWRCKRRVMDNLKLCEIHYLQGRHRQYKEKVPDSLKLPRTNSRSVNTDAGIGNAVIRAPKAATLAKLMKRKKLGGASTALEGVLKRMKMKKGSMQLELIRMVLRREVQKRRKKKVDQKARKKKKDKEIEIEDSSDGEMMRELPNGLMAISPSPSPLQSDNVGSSCAIKIGAEARPVQRRRFRSKNVNTSQIGDLQVVRCNVGKLRKCKRKKCHWCQRSISWSLIQCSSCQKTFFCIDCIRERYFDTPEEVKKACPVCRGICNCEDCLNHQSRHTECKDFLGDGAGRILRFHYLICVLLPIVKKMNKEKLTEIETEAVIKGKEPSEVDIKQDELNRIEHCCNNCKTAIVDLYRSCPCCSYNLCLSCCHNVLLDDSDGVSISKYLNGKKTCLSDKKKLLRNKKLNHFKQTSDSPWLPSSKSLHKGRVHSSVGHFSCPTKECESCSDSLLELRCTFPLNWTKELEVSAEEIVCSYDFPESVDVFSHCTLCFGENYKVDDTVEFQKVAIREDSNDNYLYYPSLLDIRHDDLEHFQKHWSRGHPVIVRNVLQTSDLSWDPIVMFCTYLERIISKYENSKNLPEASNSLDWCEVEIGIRQYFLGSLKGQTQTNTCNYTLKLKGWLSSHLFQEQFPAHYAEIMRILPLQEYMNPMSGLLNLAAKLPQEVINPGLGPCVYIAYGCGEEHVWPDSVSRLCYGSYDVVNILAHSTDVPVSTEQLTKLVNLLQRQKAQRESSTTSTNQSGVEEVGSEEKTQFSKRFAKIPCFSESVVQGVKRPSMTSNIAYDSDPLMLHCDSSQINDTDGAQTKYMEHKKNSVVDRKKTPSESCGAQWDVFRRQDVPRLSEYLRRHSKESIHKHVVHPILDQGFFLDEAHKLRLKEEFEIEPWTFEQNVGEAVIIPAGCPYQIRNRKSCVHVVLDFISPESVGESIELIDEVRLLPNDHVAKEKKLEVKKIALCAIDAAIKEVRELTNALQVPHPQDLHSFSTIIKYVSN